MDRAEQDRVMQARLAETVFCVEATSFEELKLWEEWHEQVKWEQVNPGFVETPGRISGHPVCVDLLWCRIDGSLVLFWCPCSRVVDLVLVEAWFDRNCAPTWDGGRRRARSNAMNFHLCISAIREARTHAREETVP